MMALGKWKFFNLKWFSVISAIGLGALGFFYFPVAGQIPPSNLSSGVLSGENRAGLPPFWERTQFQDGPDSFYTGNPLIMEMLAALPPRLHFRGTRFKAEDGFPAQRDVQYSGEGQNGMNHPEGGPAGSALSPAPGLYGSSANGQMAGLLSGGASAPGDGGQSEPGKGGDNLPTGPGPDGIGPKPPEGPGGEPVPEPAVWIMTLTGIAMLIRRFRRE